MYYRFCFKLPMTVSNSLYILLCYAFIMLNNHKYGNADSVWTSMEIKNQNISVSGHKLNIFMDV